MTAGDEHAGRGARLVQLDVADDPASWAAAGFSVVDDRVQLGTVSVRLAGRAAGRGITGWTLAGLTVADGDLDGLPTRSLDGADEAEGLVDDGRAPAHPNGVVGLDHVVVLSPDLQRTIGACEEAGLDLRRIRETTSYGSPMRQAFFRLGPTVLEVVSGDVGDGAPAAEAPATWFGLAVDVDDLDQTAGLLGEGLGRIKVAVQDGRRIATFKTKQFDVSVAIAAMDHRGDR